MERVTLITKPDQGYSLLDSGREQKLERYGDMVLARPDPQALWEPLLPRSMWEKADGRYVRGRGGESASGQGRGGDWLTSKDFPHEWQIAFGGLQFLIRPTSFKHTGLFPEQLSNWDWVRDVVGVVNSSPKIAPLAPSGLVGRGSQSLALQSSAPAVSILNLFGYTGGATLAAAQAGAEVTHVDASKTAVAWARENAALSGLADAPIRWIVEDALLFVKREIKRGKKYDGIIMDPPAFGHGPKNELWKIEEDFLELLRLCEELLSDQPLFVLINGYAAGYSPLAFAYNLERFVKKYGGSIQYGDLAIEQAISAQTGKVPAHTRGRVQDARLLPCGIFARWQKGE